MKHGFFCLSHPRIRTQEIDNFIRNSSLTVGYEINIWSPDVQVHDYCPSGKLDCVKIMLNYCEENN